MKKLLYSSLLAAFALALVVSVNAVKGGISLGYGKEEINKEACGATSAPIIDVVQTVQNDDDSGLAGFWALDTYDRQITVYEITPGSYCATLKYNGKFLTFAGPSPENTGTVGAGVRGKMAGGYVDDFTGDLKAIPLKPTTGDIGTYDYQCDNAHNCPNETEWTNFYFDGVSGRDYSIWWGWQYRTECNGTWTNSADGDSGDITGNKPPAKGGCPL